MFIFFLFILSVNAQEVIQLVNIQAKCSLDDLENEIANNYWSVDVSNIKDWDENESHEILCQTGYGDKKARTTTMATCKSIEGTLKIDNGPNCQPICEQSDLENNNWDIPNNWLRDWFEGESQSLDCLTSYIDIKDRTTTVAKCEKKEGSPKDSEKNDETNAIRTKRSTKTILDKQMGHRSDRQKDKIQLFQRY